MHPGKSRATNHAVILSASAISPPVIACTLHEELVLLWTKSHGERTLASDIQGGRSPEMFLGNSFADFAAGVRGDEAAAPADVANRIGFADAAAYRIIDRIVAVGCACAAVKERRPAAARRTVRPDLAALVSGSRHTLKADGRSFRCSTCDILLSRPDLRAGESGECIPVLADWRT